MGKVAHLSGIAFGFGLLLLVFSCTTKNHNFPPVAKTEVKEVVVKDTAEVKKLKAENKELRRELYWIKKTKVKSPKPAVRKGLFVVDSSSRISNCPYPGNGFPIVVQYSARTDKWPMPKGTGKRYTEILNKHNEAWDSLPHRPQDDSLFKGK